MAWFSAFKGTYLNGRLMGVKVLELGDGGEDGGGRDLNSIAAMMGAKGEMPTRTIDDVRAQRPDFPKSGPKKVDSFDDLGQDPYKPTHDDDPYEAGDIAAVAGDDLDGDIPW